MYAFPAVSHPVCLQKKNSRLLVLYTSKTSADRIFLPGISNEDRMRVVFTTSCTPVLALSDIVELHFRELIPDAAINEMLITTIGYPLNEKSQRLPWNRTVQEPTKPEVGKDKS
jgi:hypothetical protein